MFALKSHIANGVKGTGSALPFLRNQSIPNLQLISEGVVYFNRIGWYLQSAFIFLTILLYVQLTSCSTWHFHWMIPIHYIVMSNPRMRKHTNEQLGTGCHILKSDAASGTIRYFEFALIISLISNFVPVHHLAPPA
jgi:hypothetical protein